MKGRVLVIAGSDSGGGAGIQADIKTITCMGGFAMTAIAALTAQNTLGVQGILPVPPDFVRLQIDTVMNDLGADAIKIGMLGDLAVIETVAEAIKFWRQKGPLPVVLDPVMIAKGGDRLLPDHARQALIDHLVPLATVITPNLPEAAALTGLMVKTPDDRRMAARALMACGAQAVLMKGGHDAGDHLIDLLITPDGESIFEGRRYHTRHTHGTGCTMSSAIAAGLAQAISLDQAVGNAHAFVAQAIATAPGFGQGHGPLNHSLLYPVQAA